MIKPVNEWGISEKLSSKCRVFMKHISVVKTTCIKDYIKISIRQNPQQFTLHVWINELCIEIYPEIIVKSTVDLAPTLKLIKMTYLCETS